MLNLQPGDIFADHYKLVRLIDTGGFTDVWEAIFLSAGNTVALKIYPRLDIEGAKNIEDEYRNQADLSHTHLLIARYFGKHNGYPFLEMRYCSEGNASSKIGNCTETDIAKCMYNISSALAYLHENNIVHQDIKPNNFLLDKHGNFHLADLGLSLNVRNTIKRFTQSKSTSNSYIAGITPPPYRAPELYDRTNTGRQPVKATDIWAFGASLFELVTGNEPFGEFGGLNQHKSPETPDIPSVWSSQLNGIVKKCLSKETWDRPKASEIAEWGHHYLMTGNFGFENKNISQTVTNNVDKKDTLQNNKESVSSANYKKSKTLWLIAAILLVTISITVIAWMNSGSTSHKVLVNKNKDTNHVITSDTTHRLIVNKPVNNTNKTITLQNNSDTITASPKKDLSTVTTLNPLSDVSPGSSLIEISKVERSSQNLKVYFTLQKPDDVNSNYRFSIYGPDKKQYCLYVQSSTGNIYNLISIFPHGENLSFGNQNIFKFIATFEKIPDNLKNINIVEGLDRDRMGQNYWTFKGVHIK